MLMLMQRRRLGVWIDCRCSFTPGQKSVLRLKKTASHCHGVTVTRGPSPIDASQLWEASGPSKRFLFLFLFLSLSLSLSLSASADRTKNIPSRCPKCNRRREKIFTVVLLLHWLVRLTLLVTVSSPYIRIFLRLTVKIIVVSVFYHYPNLIPTW